MSEESRAYPLVFISLILSLATGMHVFVYLALGILAVLMVQPSVMRVPATLFHAFVSRVGTIISGAALSVVFVVCIIPYGYFFRAVERMTAGHFFDPRGKSSFYSPRTHVFKASDFERPW